MATWLQRLWAVATPVAFVLVSAGHSSALLGGHWIVGATSRTAMVCTALPVLPQASVAVQVREMNLVPLQLLLTTSL